MFTAMGYWWCHFGIRNLLIMRLLELNQEIYWVTSQPEDFDQASNQNVHNHTHSFIQLVCFKTHNHDLHLMRYARVCLILYFKISVGLGCKKGSIMTFIMSQMILSCSWDSRFYLFSILTALSLTLFFFLLKHFYLLFNMFSLGLTLIPPTHISSFFSFFLFSFLLFFEWVSEL